MIKISSVYLSPSKQENNIGVGDYGSEEFRMNQLADLLQPELESRGYTVYRNDPNMNLIQIVRESNILAPDIHVALHSNASLDGTGRGPLVIYSKDTFDDRLLSDSLYIPLRDITPVPGSGVIFDDKYFEIRETDAPAALVEVSFHDNPDDAEFIVENLDIISLAIADGIDNYFEDK